MVVGELNGGKPAAIEFAGKRAFVPASGTSPGRF
jgi:hypothetical protein